MSIPKAQKILFVSSLVLIIIQIPWFIVVQVIANKTQTKTTATVIRIESEPTNCSGDRSGKPDFTCDHSPREYSVYRYYDTMGVKHEHDDRFFGEYKQNNPLKKIFGKSVGDTTPAYYTKNQPESVIFMASPFAYAAWLLPLYFTLPLIGIAGVLYVIQKFKR